MALMPKRVKHRKVQRGRLKGNATRGNEVSFGDFGLQSMEYAWLKAQTIEAGRIAAAKVVCSFGFSHTSRSRPSRWKLGKVLARVNQSFGSP